MPSNTRKTAPVCSPRSRKPTGSPNSARKSLISSPARWSVFCPTRHCWADAPLILSEASGAHIFRRPRLRLRGVFRSIDIKEWVDRLGRPIGYRDAVTRGPDFDLAQTFGDKRAAQIIAQRQRPQADDRMTPFARTGAGERRAG